MDINATKKDGILTGSVKGRLDAVTASEFDVKFGEWMAAGERNVIINLSGLEYISSAGLRSILSAAKQLKANGGRLFIVELNGAVKKVFELSGFYSVLQVFDTEDAAIKQIS